MLYVRFFVAKKPVLSRFTKDGNTSLGFQDALSGLELLSTNDVAIFRSRDGTLSDEGA